MAGGLIEVELDDELPVGPRLRHPRRPWTLRRWSRVVGALAVLLAVPTVLTGVSLAGRSDRGGLPGFATDLAVPRHEVWRAPGVAVRAAAGSLVLLSPSDGEGARVVRAKDGVTVWSVDSGYCEPAAAGVGYLASAGLDPSNPAPLGAMRVLCSSSGGTDILDMATGALVGTVGPGAAPADGRLVAVEQGTEDSPGVTVRAWSLDDGALLWERHVPDFSAVRGLTISPTDVTLANGTAAVTLDTSSGARLDSTSRAVTVVESDAPGGVTVASEWSERGLRITATAADGRTLWSRGDAVLIPTGVEDPAARAVLLAIGGDGGLTGLDAGTGEELWNVPEGAFSALVHVPGIAAIGGDVRQVVDDRSGERLWSVPAGEELTAVSDRELILLRAPDTGELVVRGLSDGREVVRYRASVGAADREASSSSEVAAWGVVGGLVPLEAGTLLVTSDAGVVALAP